MEESLTLLELNQQIKEGLKNYLPKSYWVIAEISEIKINRRGHCYLDLIEKDELDDRIVAKARGIIWSSIFRMLQPYFESTTGKELTQGLKILVSVSVEFHELYGLSLNIHDIDPTYTLGELAKKRLETIKRLEDEGIFNMNKELTLPSVPQKIAVISSDTAAGYKDFMEQLSHNPYGYVFYTKLFSAYMQGDQAQESIINALEKIYQHEDIFDIVTIIRGGGAQSDLSCFDLYELAANVAQFPMPVVTGIGHEKDESVVDLVANTKQKTPTAVADFIVNQAYNFEQELFQLRDQFIRNVDNFINLENQKLISISHKVVPTVNNKLAKAKSQISLLSSKINTYNRYFIEKRKKYLKHQHHRIDSISRGVFKQVYLYLDIYKQNLKTSVKTYLSNKKKMIENFESANRYLDPYNILKRGFSITRSGDKIIKHPDDVKEGDKIETILSTGKLESVIEKKTLSINRLKDKEN
jgi:exodeoxyribonuclease VII large subunit